MGTTPVKDSAVKNINTNDTKNTVNTGYVESKYRLSESNHPLKITYKVNSVFSIIQYLLCFRCTYSVSYLCFSFVILKYQLKINISHPSFSVLNVMGCTYKRNKINIKVKAKPETETMIYFMFLSIY